MNYYEHTMPGVLSEYIQSIWGMEADSDADEYPRSMIMPDGIVEVVFHYGVPLYTWQDGNEFIQPVSFAISMMQQYIEMASRGKTGFVSVRFFPWGAHHFFNEPVRNFLDQTLEATVLWGDKTLHMVDELKRAPDIGQRFKLVEDFLVRMLQKHKKDTGKTDGIIRYIRETKGLLMVDEICTRHYISKKQLERNLLSTVGTTPKIFLRITRFLHICNNLEAYRGKNITQLTYECGFFDQSHFIKDFKSFTGFTPKEFFKKENIYFSEL